MKLILETPRLRLREMVPADLDFLAVMLADPEVMRHYPNPCTREEAQAWMNRQIKRYEEYGHGLWLVEDRVSREPLGQVGLIPQVVEGRPEKEIGWLIHRPFWRRRYATEAASGVRDHAFFERGLARVISLIRPENVPSQGVARQLGMTSHREVMHHELRHMVFELRRDRDV